MNHLLRAACLLVLPSLLAVPLAAQPLPAPAALEGYRSFDEPKPIPWREANDTVGRIGGWRAYAREAQGATASTAPAPAPAASAPGRPAAQQHPGARP
ncbi:hypothetical protein ACFPOE_21670 [Caenimonas terrae]|uniref:Uncharacterized protein n=1 Tax=Caenimonas terrae TaxID=696074 RepID=A0ABW0NIB8_9BURK